MPSDGAFRASGSQTNSIRYVCLRLILFLLFLLRSRADRLNFDSKKLTTQVFVHADEIPEYPAILGLLHARKTNQ